MNQQVNDCNYVTLSHHLQSKLVAIFSFFFSKLESIQGYIITMSLKMFMDSVRESSPLLPLSAAILIGHDLSTVRPLLVG